MKKKHNNNNDENKKKQQQHENFTFHEIKVYGPLMPFYPSTTLLYGLNRIPK